MADPRLAEVINTAGGVAILGHDRAAAHRGARGGVCDGHEGVVRIVHEGERSLDLADTMDQPVAVHSQHAGDLGQPVDAGAGGAAAQDVVDEGAVHAGHLGDMGRRQAELMGAGPQAVGQGVLLGHVFPKGMWMKWDKTGWAAREGAAVYVIPGTVAETGQARAADVLQMQSFVVDLDSGDIPAKLDHLAQHLGRPTLIVESGGRTPEGATKLHVWWKLTEPAEGADLARLCALRGEIALKVGGDTHFRSAHQPIRVPGTVYHKGGLTRLVQIREAAELEVDLAEMAERVADMPPMAGVGMASAEPREKPAIDDVLVTPVHEGGTDDWSRFEGASAAIGYFLRLVHEGRMSMDAGWTAICGYNAAMLRPAWPIDRLKRETNRLWELHIKRHGPPLIRLDGAARAQTDLPTFTLGALLDDKSPMPDDIIGPRVLTPGGLLVLGGAPKVGKSDLLIALLVHMAAGVPFLGFTPPRPLRIFYLQAEIQYHYLRERMQQIGLPPELIAAARDNLIVTPKLRMLLDAVGSARVGRGRRLCHRRVGKSARIDHHAGAAFRVRRR